MRRTRALYLGIAAGSLVLAACGGSQGPSGDQPPERRPPATAVANPVVPSTAPVAPATSLPTGGQATQPQAGSPGAEVDEVLAQVDADLAAVSDDLGQPESTEEGDPTG